MTHRSGCKLVGNTNLAEKGASTSQKESHDAPVICISQLPSAEPVETHVLQPPSIPKRHHSSFRQDRVESTVHTEIKYETSGRRHRDYVERQNASSNSSTTHYSQDVSFLVHMEFDLPSSL